MGHGLGPDTDSELSSAPPSPRLDPTDSLPPPPLSSPLSPHPTQEPLSSATEPPWKTRPRPKRQPSTSVPNPPSSPKRRKRGEPGKGKDKDKDKDKDASGAGNGKDTAGKGKAKETGATGRKGGAKAVATAKVQVHDPTPETTPEEQAPTSTLTGAKPGKVGRPVKVSPPPALAPPLAKKPAPFAKGAKSKAVPSSVAAASKPTDGDVDLPAPVKKPPFARTKSKPEPTTSKATVPNPPESVPVTKPAPFAKAASRPKPAPPKPAPSNSSKSAPSDPAPLYTKTAKRPTFMESADSSDEEEQEPEDKEKPKRHKRRKSHVEATPKPARKPRPSLPVQPTPRVKPRLEATSELRPASFMTKTSSFSFMTKPSTPSTSVNLQAREDVWSYDDLTGLTWVKLDVLKCEIVPGNGDSMREQSCWWPAEVKQNTTNGLKLCLCGLGVERELGPDVAAETNVLAFRKSNISSVRFPTFKTAFSPLVGQVDAPTTGEGESSSQPTGEPSSRPAVESSTPPTDSSTILPTSPSALETTWKQALTRAFEIDTESNDGLVDIHLLFSQKSQSPQEGDELCGNVAPEEYEDSDEEEDILDNGTTVLCRYRTRYYPAQVISYHPREGKARRRGHQGKYKCRFADDSTKIATRSEIMTTLDNGFVTCSLGSYQKYTSHANQKPTGVREPSPAPRADSPAPEPEDNRIDPEEYCSRERMRDQLKPVLPFLKGLIERKYVPGKGIIEGAESLSNPEAQDASPTKELDNPSLDNQTTKEDAASPLEPILDRHAVFIQGGRARKNLAYSVYTGDLNEDDCEELMFEISRWALRGERWAYQGCTSQEGSAVGQEVEAMSQEVGATDQEGMKAMDQEKGEPMNQEGGKGEAVAEVSQESEGMGQESGDGGATCGIHESENTSQDVQMAGVPDAEVEANSQESEHKKTEEADADVEMQDASQETSAGQETPPQTEAKSGDSTEIEDEHLQVARILEEATPSPLVYGDFRSLVKLQPPRPTGAPDYERLTPEERMGYVSDVLYPEAAALVLSYRRGIRTQPGPLADPVAEHALYTAGLQAAKNTCSAFDWVEQILSVRQLRQANSKYQVEDQAQVLVAGGTKSRPRYMTSVLK